MSALTKPKNAYKLEEMIQETNEIVEQTYYFEQKAFELNQKIEDNKRKISKSMGKRNQLQVKVDQNLVFNALKTIQTDVMFYKEQLAQNLEKEQYAKCVDKVHIIKNINELVKMLKGYGVPAKEFKKFIETSEQVNKASIENMIEMGELEIEDLKGCYKAEFNEHIQIQRLRKPSN